MLKLISLSLMSLAFAACAVEAPPVPGETEGEQIAIPDELPLEIGEEGVEGRPYSQSYCVDQSYASANNVNCEFLPVCTGQPNYDTHLSRGHRVRVLAPTSTSSACGIRAPVTTCAATHSGPANRNDRGRGSGIVPSTCAVPGSPSSSSPRSS